MLRKAEMVFQQKKSIKIMPLVEVNKAILTRFL